MKKFFILSTFIFCSAFAFSQTPQTVGVAPVFIPPTNTNTNTGTATTTNSQPQVIVAPADSSKTNSGANVSALPQYTPPPNNTEKKPK